MSVIYLIGFMGTGKTTVGTELAKQLHYSFYDSDQRVVERTGKSITELFEELGEDGFRKLEQEALQSLPIEKGIIATGGGIILKEENRLYMKKTGYVIWLDASPEEIGKRLESDSSRPLLSRDKTNQIKQLYYSRVDLYNHAADSRIVTDGKTVDEIIKEILTKTIKV